jgi:hypothetical protein
MVEIFGCGYTGVDDASGGSKRWIYKTVYEDGFYGGTYKFG